MGNRAANITSGKPREKCGIFGVYGKDFEAARLVHPGLWALQHRGQESSGIASADGKTLKYHKGVGLVAHVFSEEILQTLKGHLAIGHNRYATSGPSINEHAQPVIIPLKNGKKIALAHNGNLPSTIKLEEFLKKEGVSTKNLNDSELMAKAIAVFMNKGLSLEKAVEKAYPIFSGVFCLLVMDEKKMVAVRDRCGIRPLAIGKLNGGFIVSSETCALDIVGAKFLRDIKAGEMVTISEKGIVGKQLVKGSQKLDIFEFVYFARPDSILLGKSVEEVRQNLGIELAKERKIKADIVIPVPDSAVPAALGYSRQSGIPFYQGLIKNRYIHRTFIHPEEHTRHRVVQLKLNPMPHVLKGKKVIVVDDSIVRGTTSKEIVRMIREAGAKEVHMVISSPPIKFPDFYGVNTPNQKDLIASFMSIPEIEKKLGLDSLTYLSYQGLIKATGLGEDMFCTSCFTGVYPIDIAERAEGIEYKKESGKLASLAPSM